MQRENHHTRLAELVGVGKCFNEVRALDDVSLSIAPGETVAVLGPNGAGKTTAVALLLGLLSPDEGEVRLFGQKPGSRALHQKIGVMLQISGVPETLTVTEHITLFSSYYPRPRPLEDLIRAAGLEGLENRRYGALSGGQQQRVLFALALCGDPELLFLDEPTAGLDVAARRSLWTEISALANDGRGILLTTHYLEEADALADRVVVLHQGRVVAEGTPSEIKARTLGRTIRCTTSLEDTQLETLAGIESLSRQGSRIELLTHDADSLVRSLFALDPDLRDLEITGAALEDAFLALTAPETKTEGKVA